ncbi:Uncharacterised protein [Staphylococcus aureus]|nr:Uncharacterised protein [Staphylococcus aureus]
MFWLTGSGTSNLFLIPSKPACKIAANAKYGFAAGSTERTSTRVGNPRDDGTRINGERFLPLHAM